MSNFFTMKKHSLFSKWSQKPLNSFYYFENASSSHSLMKSAVIAYGENTVYTILVTWLSYLWFYNSSRDSIFGQHFVEVHSSFCDSKSAWISASICMQVGYSLRTRWTFSRLSTGSRLQITSHSSSDRSNSSISLSVMTLSYKKPIHLIFAFRSLNILLLAIFSIIFPSRFFLQDSSNFPRFSTILYFFLLIFISKELYCYNYRFWRSLFCRSSCAQLCRHLFRPYFIAILLSPACYLDQ